jgi:NADH-quinone oxidoreductase subunit J
MTLDLLLFLVLALLAIATAMGMLMSRNAIYSALFLVLNFVIVAVFYLLLSAPFIAMAQITVYAGAIMVLFLFVIMLLGAEAIPGRPGWNRFVLPIGLAVILGIEAVILFTTVNTMENLRQMGLALFNDYLLPFEVTSVLLLVAMLGVIVLVRKEKRVL